MIQLDIEQLNQIETKLCYLVCAIANCAVCDDCDVMLACLVLVIVCLFIYRLDENVAGVYEEGDYFEQQEPEHFVEQGKLLR